VIRPQYASGHSIRGAWRRGAATSRGAAPLRHGFLENGIRSADRPESTACEVKYGVEGSAHESAEALLALLNDILDFSKIEAGHLELEAISFNLRTTLESVADSLAHRAEDKGLEIACDIRDDCPVYLRGDPGRLRQVLVNLAGNAVKFTERGEVVIQVQPVIQTESQVMIRFSVRIPGSASPLSSRRRSGNASSRPTARRPASTAGPAWAWRSPVNSWR